MRLWVRAAASPTVGLGHLLRQVAIVEQAAGRGVPAAFVVDDVGLASQAIDRFALDATVIDAGGAWREQVAEVDIVLFDGYQFGPDDHREARATGCVVAAVDDRGRGRFDVDLLCDHNPRPVGYDLPPGATLLHGLRYGLVRQEFRGGRQPAADDHDHLLVAFGGSDAAGLLPRAMDALAERSSFPTVTVLVGPAATRPAGSLPAGTSIVAAPADVAAVHASADAALITVGTTLWELLGRGTPTAAISLDPLHREVAAAVAAEEALLDAGDPDDWIERLPATVAQLADPTLRQVLADNARRLVDGRGPERVLDALLARLER